MPEQSVDLSGMTLGTTLRAADLKLPEGVSVHHPDVVIASVIAYSRRIRKQKVVL